MMNPIVIIPARMGSTRLPRKPMAIIAGRPMIVHVWSCAVASAIGPVHVATDHPEILDAVKQAGGDAVLTDGDMPSGSDRVHQAVEYIDPASCHDIVVNLQGDLPLFGPELLPNLLPILANPDADIATLIRPIAESENASDPEMVKCVFAPDGEDGLGRALYFSRNVLPAGDGPLYKHIGIYAYRRAVLRRFVSLPSALLENREKLEQLRCLSAGMRIHAAIVPHEPISVDTAGDLQRARQAISARVQT